jgi:hypothetical protein
MPVLGVEVQSVIIVHFHLLDTTILVHYLLRRMDILLLDGLLCRLEGTLLDVLSVTGTMIGEGIFIRMTETATGTETETGIAHHSLLLRGTETNTKEVLIGTDGIDMIVIVSGTIMIPITVLVLHHDRHHHWRDLALLAFDEGRLLLLLLRPTTAIVRDFHLHLPDCLVDPCQSRLCQLSVPPGGQDP